MLKLKISILSLLFSAQILYAQSGFVLDRNHRPISEAILFAKGQKLSTTDSTGAFNLGPIMGDSILLTVSRLGYFTKNILVRAADFPITILLDENPLEAGEVIVRATNAGRAAPVSVQNLEKREIAANYQAQDIPLLMQITPSVNAHSDAGSMAGYSYFRMRGMDQTRINFSINGVPVNDPENQGFFTHNFSDLLSSAAELQVQRGAGVSANGTSSLAGSVQVTTATPADSFQAMVTVAAGSFNTLRTTAEVHSGKLGNGPKLYARFSQVRSDGFRDNSASEALGFFAAALWEGKKSSTEFNAWGGSTRNQLSYLGLVKADFETRPQTNYLTPEETDRFRQFFARLRRSQALDSKNSLHFNVYTVRGVAPEFKVRFGEVPLAWLNMPDVNDSVSTTDAMGSYLLDQWLGGASAYWQFKSHRWESSVGFHANYFSALHSMQTVQASVFPAGFAPGAIAHENRGYKDEQSAFGKFSYRPAERWLLFADLQLRRAAWRYRAVDQPIARDTFNVDDMQWWFFNPRIGLRRSLNERTSAYLALARTSREPTRFDYLQDDRANFDIAQHNLQPEKLWNAELGFNHSSKSLSVDANIFLMLFDNQLVNSGQLNTFGYPIMSNVGRSTRTGAEISYRWHLSEKLYLAGNAAVMRSIIKQFTVNYSLPDFTQIEMTYGNVATALTPNFISNTGISVLPVKELETSLRHRHVSAQFLDNTQNHDLQIPAFNLLDFQICYRMAFAQTKVRINLWINNLLDARYAPSGATGGYQAEGTNSISTTAYFFPAMGRNFMAGLQFSL